MARPPKLRKIAALPVTADFVPSGEGSAAERNILKLEELEAIRLKDLLGLEQEECAARMEVSRPTFQRILLCARRKVADSLIHGKGLHIEGGNATRRICPVRCGSCGREWSESVERLQAAGDDFSCPSCGSSSVRCMRGCGARPCGKRCRQRDE